jgi:hypothetical protein
MGSSARAHLAYGYDLGGGEDFKAAERGEYGEPKLPWLTDDDVEGDHDDFGTEVEKLLLASVGFTEEFTPDSDYWIRRKAAEERVGVELAYSGHSDYAGWLLVITDSQQSVEWSEAMELDLPAMADLTADGLWNAKLTAALAALGITPTQDGPKWLVYPSYG